VSRYEPVRTGGERYNWEVIEGLRRRGIDVVVRDENGLPAWSRYGPQAWVGFLNTVYAERKCTHIFAVHGIHRRLVPALRFAKSALKKKIVVLVHHLSSPLKTGSAAFQERLFEKWFAKSADVVVAVSEYTADAVVALGVPRNKISVIYPALDPPGIRKPVKDKLKTINILSIGVISPRKGYDIAIESLAGLGDNFALIIAGDDTACPAYVEKLRGLSASLGFSDKVRFAGRVSDDELEELFAEADIYIQPSFLEGFGISALEAAARGIPVITTDVGAIPEIFEDGSTALFVEAGDSGSLRTAVERLATDERLREKLAASGPKIPFVKRMWREVADEFYRDAFLRLT
jgi:glycosyltransferase involved in cell wall biosynthesis